MKHIVLLCSFSILASAMDAPHYSHNTYMGQEITPENLLHLMPKMPDGLKVQVKKCMAEYSILINQLVTTPHPLTHENRKQKTKDNFAIIKEYEDKDEVKNLSKVNYVLRFKNYPGFTMAINRWGNRVAHWIYSSGQGNVLDANFNADSTDCSQFEYVPEIPHCSMGAHYLRTKEAIEQGNFTSMKITPTYLQHIPGKPRELSDENYVPIQVWVDNLKTVRELGPEKALEIRENISPQALKEIHETIIYAALWDITAKLSVDGINSHYYIRYLEKPFNHKQQLFYFRGQEGKKKYVEDVVLTLERMAKAFLALPEQFIRWNRLTKDHRILKNLCDEFKIYPNFDPEYLFNKDLGA